MSGKKTRYVRLVSDGDAVDFGTGHTYPPGTAPSGSIQELAVAFQPDASANGDPYEVLLDRVSLQWFPFNLW